MKVFTHKTDNAVIVQARAEGDGCIGDMILEIKPGDSFLEHDYAWWAALDDGEHDLTTA